MRIVEHHIGISLLENGDKVLTPFSYFGRAYRYSEELYARFVTAMRLLQWITVLCVVAGGALALGHRMTVTNLLELITVVAALGDLARVFSAKILFRSGQRYQITPRFSEVERSFFVLGNLGAAFVGMSIVIFFETIFVLGLVTDILLRRDTFFSTIPVLALLHLVSYGLAGIRAYQRN